MRPLPTLLTSEYFLEQEEESNEHGEVDSADYNNNNNVNSADNDNNANDEQHPTDGNDEADENSIFSNANEENYFNVNMKLDVVTRKMLLVEDMKQYRKDCRNDEEKYYELYSFIWNRCSLDAQQQLENQEEFSGISSACDTVGLWKLIENTFLRMDNYNDKRLASFTYNRYFNERLCQYPNESVATFKDRFDYAVKAFSHHNITPPPDDQLALMFIDKLDERRYANFKKKYMRDLKRAMKPPPTCIQEALDEVNKYRFNNPNSEGGYRNNRNQFSKNSSVFVAKANKSDADYNKAETQPSGDNNIKQDDEDKIENKNNKNDVVCYGCKQRGHIRPKCPNRKRDANAKTYVMRSSFFCMTAKTVEEASDKSMSDQVNTSQVSDGNLSDEPIEIKYTQLNVTPTHEQRPGYVLLDTCAQASVVNDRKLLSNIRVGKVLLVIEGVTDGTTESTRYVGDLGSFGEVFFCEKIRVSVLSFADVCDRSSITYLRDDDVFRVVCSDGVKHQFYRAEKMYMTNMNNDGIDKNDIVPQSERHAITAPTTVREREKLYHRHEIRRAKEAQRVCRCLGYEGYDGLLNIIRTGAFSNLGITPQDVRRANDIYGPLIAHIKGTSTRKKPEFRNPIKIERVMDIMQALHVDIMYVEQIAFLIGVSKPMNLVTVEKLPKTSASFIGKVIYNFIDTYRSNSYEIERVISDNEPSVAGPLSRLPGIKHDPVGTGVHVSVIESKIRRIKEKVRAILHSLPYNWPKKWLHWVIYFAVRARNRIPVRGSGTVLSPVEILTGIKCDAKKDLRVAFGDYVQAREMDTDKSMKERTKGCIALLPLGNLEGSVKFLDLATLETITRTTWTPLPITQETIDYINSLCERENDVPIPRDPTIVYRQGQVIDEDDYLNDEFDDVDEFEEYENDFDDEEHIDERDTDEDIEEVLRDNNNEDINPEQEVDNNQDAEVAVTNDDFANENNEEATVTRSGRTLRPSARLRDEEYVSHIPKVNSKLHVLKVETCKVHIFNMTTKQGIDKYADEAVKSIYHELRSLLGYDVWEPIQANTDIKDIKEYLVPSKLFLKDKFKPNGEFDKLKSRLVAGGHMQDRTLYPDKSSPTPSINSIFIIAALAAQQENEVATLDIGNAYVNARITGPPVYMKINAELAKYICDIDKDYVPYLRHNGELIVKLKKALYGCVQSSLLWFKHISSILIEAGFKQNPCDECVFNCGSDEDMMTVIVYVDDLFISAKNADDVDDFISYIESKFDKVTVHRGSVQSYLGMNFIFGGSIPKSVQINMSGYIADLMSDYKIQKTVTTPANNNLFKETKSTPLSSEKSKELHTIVAKLLYLATRVRFEILLAVNYLTTRVNKFNQGDWEKAQRILEYLNGTQDIGLTLCIGKDEQPDIHLFADASYGVHEDGKSHSAGVVTLGNATVSVKSQKQKIVTKSSTEAELVCGSDMIGIGYHVKDFLAGQGIEVDKIDLHQDNTSTISMMIKGGSSNSRTRHIRVRYFFIKERIESGEVNVRHTATEDMVADILTKPLQGARFVKLRDMLLNSMVANV